MSINLNVSKFIGKNIKDENNIEIGKILSFLMNSSGQTETVLVQNIYGKLVTYPIKDLVFDKDEVFHGSNISKKVEYISEQLPVMEKKSKILEDLSKSRLITQEVFENLSKEFEKFIKDMRKEAETILNDMDKQVHAQEDQVKMLQLARAFLEIEHRIGKLKDDSYQQSIMPILQGVKNAQQRKIVLLRTKERVSNILLGEKEKTETQIPQKTNIESESNTKTFKIQDETVKESTEKEAAISVHIKEE
jgi:hypothetical protein